MKNEVKEYVGGSWAALLLLLWDRRQRGLLWPLPSLVVNYGDMSATCLPTRQMSSYLGRQAKCHDTEASLSAK